MKRYRFLFEIGIIGGTALVLNYFNIRVCPFYNIFHIPCPGCGLSRAYDELIHLNFRQSIRYNILAIPILLFLISYFILVITKREKIINTFLDKHKAIIIVISILLLILVEIININNPLLY